MSQNRPRAQAIFYVTAAVAIGGAVTVLVGSQMPWTTGTIPGRVVSSDEGRFRFPEQVETFDADDLGSGTTAAGAAALVVTILPLLVGPRVRPSLYVLAAILGGTVIATTQMAAALDYPGTTAPAAGRTVSLVAGAVVMAAALIAIGPSSAVPRLRMPERAPDEGE